ncbi:hypothetical protein CERZMDRAFT_102998 [Cercospora zeae-maydis SCOH1-5]|uniref:Uncharacterized protein n=1 Tax=Cercospora zeae-maydis SCOH1-5 TaxID=717836 RepID=A0A6A6F0R3_9PEZI|nr:hypothetical protein CERZMDRAFT_102998 [Cercospora zeae-maydis SCOH1-5]
MREEAVRNSGTEVEEAREEMEQYLKAFEQHSAWSKYQYRLLRKRGFPRATAIRRMEAELCRCGYNVVDAQRSLATGHLNDLPHRTLDYSIDGADPTNESGAKDTFKNASMHHLPSRSIDLHAFTVWRNRVVNVLWPHSRSSGDGDHDYQHNNHEYGHGDGDDAYTVYPMTMRQRTPSSRALDSITASITPDYHGLEHALDLQPSVLDSRPWDSR